MMLQQNILTNLKRFADGRTNTNKSIIFTVSLRNSGF
jgi:hypothetical protein